MDKDALETLLEKYQQGTCSAEEKRLVEEWYESYDSRQEKGLSFSQQQDMFASLARKMEEESSVIHMSPALKQRKTIFKAVAAAASILLLVGSVYWLSKNREKQEARQVAKANFNPQADLPPGGQKATLTLGDGSTIQLDEAKDGILASQGNAKVIKLKNGELSYRVEQKADSVATFNIVQTPRGGQYQVTLPDGSHVWLNAASTIKFPTSFASHERKIELTGEAYFEIAHDASKPFLVTLQSKTMASSKCTIEVLGTHFNVMAYGDEDLIKTTLLEGSVKLTGDHLNKILKPGQQADIKPDFSTVVIQQADLDEVMAWKNNLFWFNRADISSVMRQISRWYDVDISYEGNVSKIFKGTVPRDMSAAKLFDILERTGGVHFKIINQKVIVMP